MIKQKIFLLIVIILFIFIPCSAQGIKNDLDKIVNESIHSMIKMHEDSVKENAIKKAGNNKYYFLTDNLYWEFTLSKKNSELGCESVYYKYRIPFKELKKGVLCISYSFLEVNKDTIEIRLVMGNMKAKKRIKTQMADDGTGLLMKATRRNWRLLKTNYYNEWEREYKFV